jgi:hypothetical protein
MTAIDASITKTCLSVSLFISVDSSFFIAESTGKRLVILCTILPACEYMIKVALPDGTEIPSMSLGPVEIPAGVDVRIQAQLAAGKTPILNARVK